jgi:hypothetical protein
MCELHAETTKGFLELFRMLIGRCGVSRRQIVLRAPSTGPDKLIRSQIYSTVHKWVRRHRDGGAAALADRSSRPHRSPHRTPVEAFLAGQRRGAGIVGVGDPHAPVLEALSDLVKLRWLPTGGPLACPCRPRPGTPSKGTPP